MILSYFGNDIADVGRAVGQPPPLPERYTDWFGTRFGVLIEISHLVNFVYWSIPQDDLRDWWQYYIDLYQDPRALRLHEAELNAFVQQAAKKNAKLVVVIFPFLHMLENSTVYTGKIEQIFNAVGVPTLDVSTLVQDLGLKQRIVNTNDVHASKEVNHRIARALHELIDGET